MANCFSFVSTHAPSIAFIHSSVFANFIVVILFVFSSSLIRFAKWILAQSIKPMLISQLEYLCL